MAPTAGSATSPASATSSSPGLIDGGKSVGGRLTDKEQIGSWTRLVMEVVLND